MSKVTNVIMTTVPDETNDWEKLPLLGQLNPVDQYAGGKKSMEVDVFMGGYNHLDRAEILKEFRSVKWECLEDAQLIVKEQEDESFTVYFATE